MSSSLNDTDSMASAFLAARLREMTPEQKLRRVSELTVTAAQLSLAGLRARYPGESEGGLLLRLARIRLGDALVDAAYPDIRPSADARGGA